MPFERKPADKEPKLGLLRLDTSFFRMPGDVGNALSFGVPLAVGVVQGATARDIVMDPSSKHRVLDKFVETGKRLVEEENAVALITSCGFLSLMQDELSRRLPVPVASSSLLQIPWVRALYGNRPDSVGVITFSASALTPAHFDAAHVPQPYPPSEGMEAESEWHNLILEGAPHDAKKLESDMVDAAKRLQEKNPNMKAVILECANMPPFAKKVSEVTGGLPCFSVLTLGEFMFAGAAPKSWPY